jgi:hypothetical protein
MAYTPTTWTEGVTTLGPTNMNHIEGGIAAIDSGGAAAKGSANGYASLDGTTKVPAAQIPDLSATYQAVSGKGAASGYASLDAGAKVPAAQLPVLAGSELAYQQFTANVSVTGTVQASAMTVVTAPAFTADGSSSYWVEFFAMAVAPHNGQDAAILFDLWESATDVATIAWIQNPGASAGGTMRVPVRARSKLTPAAGSRTYSIRAWLANDATAATVYAGAGSGAANAPGYIGVYKA